MFLQLTAPTLPSIVQPHHFDIIITMTETILEVEKLVKNYGSFRAVDGISFAVPKGKVVGFLGPNGAGKTTTIHMLLGITLTNGGSIKYFGKDFSRHRLYCLQRINFTSAFNTLLGRITVQENLLVFAKIYQVKHAKEKILKLTEYFEISDLLPILYQNLSAGQKTRVNLVKSLLNDPELILMDEPTASLDPDIADKTLTLIEKLKCERNLAILYTSHNMHEITRVCDEVIFLDHGKIVAQDTPFNLTKRISSANMRLTFANSTDKNLIEQYLKAQTQNFSFFDNHTVTVHTEENLIPQVLFALSHTGVSFTDIEIHKPTLEDVFLQIARKELYESKTS
jgi:ABC-2 type transport system ATP-binding protein